MANSNPYLILRRVRDQTIKNLRRIFAPESNLAVTPTFTYPYFESASTGTITFYGNPSNGNTLTIGLNTITFVTGAPVGLQVHIGISQQVTLANLVALINANSGTLKVTSITNSIPNQLTLIATIAGADGDLITLSTTSKVLVVSHSTLLNGGLWNFDTSKIFIGDAIPQDYAALPMLVVDTASASETRYLGPEDLSWTKNSFNVVTEDKIFSSLVVTVNINLYTIDDTIARDEIIDLIYNNISEIRDDLAAHGIEMIRRTLPTESRVLQDGRYYITNRFTLEVYCEWSDVDTDPSTVSAIDITIPLSGPVPFINSPLSYSWDASGDVPFSYQVTATNNPTSYSSSVLPIGLSLDAGNGLISGIPTDSGTFYITLHATNANGTGDLSLSLTIIL